MCLSKHAGNALYSKRLFRDDVFRDGLRLINAFGPKIT
jgi:hypothetical protein